MKVRIREAGFALTGLVHEASEESAPAPTALVAPGLPYTPSAGGMVERLHQQGFNAFQWQYPGTFDSAGSFSPQSAVQSLNLANELLKQPSVFDLRSSTPVSLSTDGIQLLAGHSFGTWVITQALARGDVPVSSALLFSPFFDVGRNLYQAGVRADLSGQAIHIAEALPLTFRMSSLAEWKAFFGDGLFPWPPVVAKEPHPNPTRLYVSTGADDSALDPTAVETVMHSWLDRYRGLVTLEDWAVVEGVGHEDLPLYDRLLAAKPGALSIDA